MEDLLSIFLQYALKLILAYMKFSGGKTGHPAQQKVNFLSRPEVSFPFRKTAHLSRGSSLGAAGGGSSDPSKRQDPWQELVQDMGGAGKHQGKEPKRRRRN